MWTPACYLSRWPFGRLETVFPSRHSSSLHPSWSWGEPHQSRGFRRASLSGAIDIVASEALRDSLPAGNSTGEAQSVSETGPGAAGWLTAVPLFQALQIEDECFRTAPRLGWAFRTLWWPASGYASARGASGGHPRRSAPASLRLR
jgi:hypothetical protein